MAAHFALIHAELRDDFARLQAIGVEREHAVVRAILEVALSPGLTTVRHSGQPCFDRFDLGTGQQAALSTMNLEANTLVRRIVSRVLELDHNVERVLAFRSATL